MSDDSLITKTELRSRIRKASAVYVAAAFHGDRMAVVRVSKAQAFEAIRDDYDDYPDREPCFQAKFGGPDDRELFIG